MAGQGRTGVVLLLFAILAIPSSEAKMHLFDPRLCYILDGFLMFYGVMITALFVKERCGKPKTSPSQDSTYAALVKKPEDNYDVLSHNRGDVESGSGRGRRQQAHDDTYTALSRPDQDTYKSIQPKKDRRQKDDQVYQGLRTGTKDTYAKLQPRQQTR
ncbi:protein CREG1 isoform X3 [Engraulis encrasicolus]|uniref:protein CREG1 isoform X3 n=1 Tax=Engraulis encrasicolus TaxID=184585 RepID=UPI002FCFFF7E